MTDTNSPQNATQPVTAESAPEAKPRNWGRLERPGTRRRLMHELARGDKTQKQLAQEYGVVESSITEFKQRHQEQIGEIARDIDNEFAGLWIADKTNRIDALQELFEQAQSPEIDDRKFRRDVLRSVAEELGQIPNRTTVDFTQPVEVKLVGLDVEEL